eukprot:15341877-Ditylum_brightwellii.AAC.1
MEHTEYDLRANGIHMWFRQIQSKDVIKGFYLQNFSPDAELKFWSEFFRTGAKSWQGKKDTPSAQPKQTSRLH